MGFLAPLIPVLKAAAPKIAATVGSGLIGSALAGSGPTEREEGPLARAETGGDIALGLASSAAPRIQSLFDIANRTYNPVANYWSGLLSGNRAGMTSLLAPEVGRIGEGYRAANQSTASLLPRGGPRADFLSQLPYQQQRDVSTLFQSVRPMAAQSLFEVGQGAETAGSRLFSNAVQSIYGTNLAGRNLLGYEQARRTSDREAGRSIGASIFDIIQEVPFGEIFNRGGGTGTGTGTDKRKPTKTADIGF